MKTKDLILKVAGEEFAKYGFDAVSMNDLVKKLDVNKATIYYHFKDKQTLYKEIIKNAMQKGIKNIEMAFEDDKDGVSLLKKFVNAMILTIKDNPNIVQIALREMANFGANIDDSFVPLIEKEINYLSIILKKLDLKDEYKNIDTYTLYALIFGSTKTFYAIQMSDLQVGVPSLKQESEKTLNYMSEFVSNIILDAIVK